MRSEFVLAILIIFSTASIISAADIELKPKPDVVTTTGTDPTVTATDPSPTVTTTEPTPTVTTTDPTPTVTATEPTPTVTVADPTPTVTATEPTPTVTVADPTPTVTATGPTPTVTTPVEDPNTNTTPTPTVTTPVEDPNTNTTPTPTNTTPIPTNTTPVPTNTTPIPTNTTPANTTPVPTQTQRSSSGGGSSGSSGGSSGGTGVFSVEPFSNIAAYENREEKLIANTSVEYSFSSTEIAIYKVLVNGKQNEYDIQVRIDSLRNKSVHAKKPAPGTVYRYENVLLGTKRVNYIAVKFRVKNSWMEENGLNESIHPYLLKYNGTTWLALVTNVTGKDGMYTYFEAPKAGSSQLGIFAISVPPKKANGPWPTATIVEEEEEIVPIKEEIEVVENKKMNMAGFEIVIAMIGMIISAMYVMRKR